ncbi:MAG: hypothetical protein H6765_09090 [Candidatus Peribacteria bacterium]|nr:MAG: hypothetical protein H6765_09090 [Candidatus Peribacteria bacterium]
MESIIAVGGFLATLIFPYLETYAYPAFPIAIIGSMLLLLYTLKIVPADPVKKNVDHENIFNIRHNIQKSRHFIKVNKGYPLFFLSVMLFEGIFYATVWFLFPLHLIHDSAGAGLLEGLSL